MASAFSKKISEVSPKPLLTRQREVPELRNKKPEKVGINESSSLLGSVRKTKE